jgi:hypothetical protein
MDNWKHFSSWDTVLPPNRPGRVETDLLRTCLLNLSKDIALVMGATPEYRNLLKLFGFKSIVVIEKNIPFLNSLSHISIDSEVETIVEGDWLDVLPDFKGKCSIVISDTTLGNVPFENQDSLQALMCEALKPEGILFDRILHYREGLCNWDSINETFRFLPLNLETANLFHIMAIFRSPVIAEIGKVNARSAYDSAVKQNPQLRYITELTKLWVTPEVCEWYYDGQFRHPFKVYDHFLSSLQEINYELLGFGRNISIVIGKM